MSQNKKSKKSLILNFITFILLLIGVYFTYQYYKVNDFNDFVRSETNLYTSEFKRDKEIKYSNMNSYKIKSDKFNDAMFYKKITVEKNQPYKVTCMVKTKNVETKNNTTGAGAQIAIEGTTERSVAILGTEDWQKIELIFNSKDRTEINIGFRLGGYLDDAKGETWFSDFTLEEGTLDSNNTWNFACFIFETTDVNIDGKQINLEVTKNDITDISNTINRFETACSELSENKMLAKCDTYKINTPLSSLSYDKEYGYYVSPEDVELQIKDTIANSDYDHIFVIVKLR